MPLHNFTKIFLVLSEMFLVSCSQVRESAGVNRKAIDEFNAIENPPLVIPPDLDLVEPGQIKLKNIQNAEKELAEEIFQKKAKLCGIDFYYNPRSEDPVLDWHCDTSYSGKKNC